MQISSSALNFTSLPRGSLVLTIRKKAEENIRTATMLLFNIIRQYYLGTGYLLFQHLLSYTITERRESWTIGFCLSIKLLLRNLGNVQVDTNRIAFIPTSIKIDHIDLKLKCRTPTHTYVETGPLTDTEWRYREVTFFLRRVRKTATSGF